MPISIIIFHKKLIGKEKYQGKEEYDQKLTATTVH